MKPSPSRQEKTKRDAERDRPEQFAHARGRYSLEEAAEELARHTGELVSMMQEMVGRAAFEKKFKVYKTGSIVHHEYVTPASRSLPMPHGIWKLCVQFDNEEAYSDDLNAWLKNTEPHINYRFRKSGASKTVHGISPSSGDWIEKAHEIAHKIALKRHGSGMCEISARNICKEVADELGKDSTTHGNRGPRVADAVRTQGLKGWKFSPPSNKT